MQKTLLVSMLLALAFAGAASAARYEIDANHTQVEFTYSHLGFSNITGRFGEVDGHFDFDPANPAASKIDVTLPMASLSTGVPKLDSHLASPDFFDAEKFPVATFKSNKVTVLDKDRLSVDGDLTIHGVTRPVVLAVSINKLGDHPMRKTPAVGFDATTTIKRSEFGIDRMVPAVSDAVRLDITLEAQQPKAKATE